MKHFLLFGLFWVAGSNAGAQTFLWGEQYGANESGFCLATAVDAMGNSYNTGYFLGVSDFDPGPGVTNLSAAGTSDMFIQKLDPNGHLIWAKRIGSTLEEQGHAIIVSNAGNVYVTGSFRTRSTLIPGRGWSN